MNEDIEQKFNVFFLCMRKISEANFSPIIGDSCFKSGYHSTSNVRLDTKIVKFTLYL